MEKERKRDIWSLLMFQMRAVGSNSSAGCLVITREKKNQWGRLGGVKIKDNEDFMTRCAVAA